MTQKKFSLINDNGKNNGFDALRYFGIAIELNSYNEGSHICSSPFNNILEDPEIDNTCLGVQ